LREGIGDCPPALDDLVSRCLQRDPDDRPESADQVISILREVLATLGEGKNDDWPVQAAAAAAVNDPGPVVEGGTFAGPVLGNQTIEQPTMPAAALPPPVGAPPAASRGWPLSRRSRSAPAPEPVTPIPSRDSADHLRALVPAKPPQQRGLPWAGEGGLVSIDLSTSSPTSRWRSSPAGGRR
jgi:serine/threonine protein kinase